jgi:hypothetical protein
MTPFSIYQRKWSVLERSFERDIIPMARAEWLALRLMMCSVEVKSGQMRRKLVGARQEKGPHSLRSKLGAHGRREKVGLVLE